MGILTGELHKLVFGGTLATNDTWACSIHMATQDAETELDFPALSLVRPPLVDWFARGTSFLNQSATLDFIKLNKVNRADGKYTDSTDANTLFNDPVLVAGGGHGYGPPQLSMALTWHTDIVRGRASKGRIYPPSSDQNVGTPLVDIAGHVDAAMALAAANSAQELLAELNNATTNLTCCVWSQVGQQARAIERVSVGRVIDTQRRRRSQLDEVRVFATAAV